MYIYILFDKVKIIVIICLYFPLYRGPQGRLVLPTVFYPRKIKTLLTYLLTYYSQLVFCDFISAVVTDNFQMKNCVFFLSSIVQGIYCGYSLKPLQ